MTRIRVFDSDDLQIRVPVTFDAGSPISTLAGATVEAYAASPDLTVTASVSADVPTQTIICVFAEWAFQPGQYDLQVLVTSGGFTQTVATETISISRSAKPRP